jgi:hypothetical protein
VTVPCRYSKIGEVDGNLTGLLAAKGISTPFGADSAPAVYARGQPGRTNPAVRVLGEIFDRSALPPGMRAHRGTLIRAGEQLRLLRLLGNTACRVQP